MSIYDDYELPPAGAHGQSKAVHEQTAEVEAMAFDAW